MTKSSNRPTKAIATAAKPAAVAEPGAGAALAAGLSDSEWIPLLVKWLERVCDRLDTVDVEQLSAQDAAAWASPIEGAAGRIRKFASHRLGTFRGL